MIPPKPSIVRSTKWPTLRKKWLKVNPNCRGCNTTSKLQVHHLIPVHLDPTKELDVTNLITLCELAGHDCHFHLGHLLDWLAYNPVCPNDSDIYLQKVKNRPTGGGF